MFEADLFAPAPVAQLEPLGKATLAQESFRSYFQRICDEHAISPAILLSYICPERIRTSTSCSQRLKAKANAFNDELSLAKALGAASQAEGLHHLAFEPFRSAIFGHMGFYKAKRAWCTACLCADPVPYERAIWRLVPVTYCPVHASPLVSDCPVCRCPVRANTTTRFDRCPSCKRSLVVPRHKSVSAASPMSDWQRLALRELEALLRRLHEATPRSAADLPDLVEHLLQLTGSGSLRQTAEHLSLTEGFLTNLRHGVSKRPGMEQWFLMSLGTGIPLLDLLTAKPLSTCLPVFEPLFPETKCRKRTPKAEKIASIRAYAENVGSNLISLGVLRKRFRCSILFLRRNVRDVVERVKANAERHRALAPTVFRVYARGRFEEASQRLYDQNRAGSRNYYCRTLGTHFVEKVESHFPAVLCNAPK
jgi:hypothetical protein